MGLFSRKTTITVSTAALHLMQAADNPIAEAAATATITKEEIVDKIQESLLAGYGIKIRPAYNYAVENYTLGLPTGNSIALSPVSDAVLAPIIAADIGHPDSVSISTSLVMNMNPVLALFPWLIGVRKYNSNTERIQVYPDDLVPSIASLTSEGKRIAVYISDVALATDEVSLDITYNVVDTLSSVQEMQYVENVSIPAGEEFIYDTPCVYAVYKKLDAQGTPLTAQDEYWIYYVDTHTYPALSGTVTPATQDTFLPVVPLRYNNADLCAPAYQDTDLYQTSKTLLSKLDMDIEDLASKINAHPSIGDIDHAYVVFGVDLQTSNKYSLWYLGAFFDRLHEAQGNDRIAYLNSLIDSETIGSTYNAYQTGALNATTFTEHGLNLRVNFDYITVHLMAGTVGRIGQATKTIEGNILTLRMQVQKNTIKKVTVHGLSVTNTIYRSKGVHTTAKDVATDPDNHNLVIPIEYNLAKSLRLLTRNQLYQDSTLMVINTFQKTKEKWYQTGWFRVVLIIVAIVITIYTGQAWVTKLVAASYALANAIAIVVVAMIAISVAIKFVATWLVDKFGTKMGLLAAVVLFVVALVFSRGLGSIELLKGYVVTTAQMMTQAAMALVSSTNQFLIEEGERVVDEYMAFREKMEDRWEELKTAQNLLENDYDISPLEYTAPARLKMAPYESPDAFIQRTVELPANTFYTIHDQIPTFYEKQMALPMGVSFDLYNQNIRT